MKDGTNYYFYHNDHLGTPQKMTAVNGAVVWSAKYSSFGEADVDGASTITNNLRFPGQYFDSETGLHYNCNRYYIPSIGRYLTTDPIGLNGGIHLFAYVNNNSINFSDSYGLTVNQIADTNALTCDDLQRFKDAYKNSGASNLLSSGKHEEGGIMDNRGQHHAGTPVPGKRNKIRLSTNDVAYSYHVHPFKDKSKLTYRPEVDLTITETYHEFPQPGCADAIYATNVFIENAHQAYYNNTPYIDARHYIITHDGNVLSYDGSGSYVDLGGLDCIANAKNCTLK
jgi:RHS repeat-associated protein